MGGGRTLLEDSVVSSVNWSEVMQKASSRHLDAAGIAATMDRIGLAIIPFVREDAEEAAGLWTAGRPIGLSLGDRACLALARRLRLPAVTAERAWARLAVDVAITVIR